MNDTGAGIVPSVPGTAGAHIPAETVTRYHASIAGELRAALKTSSPVRGLPSVQLAEFEREYARYCDARFAIGVSSGTLP